MLKADKKKKSEFLLNEWLYVFFTIVFSVLAFIFFKWGREIHFAKKGFVIDSSLFGAYGDFIGGVLGTIFSLVSVLLVIKTFQHQRLITTNNSKQIELQRFHDLFFELLRVYQSQVDEMCVLTEGVRYNNKDFFDYEKKQIQDDFQNKKSFIENQTDSVKHYMVFYIENQAKLGAYFRTLFRIYSLIDSSELEEPIKRDYLKIMRAQLTDSELFFLRYNAMTFYGHRFVEYINKYHILKHLPAFELLEFKDWWSGLDPVEKTGVNIVYSLIYKGIRFLLSSNQENYIVLPSSGEERFFLAVHKLKQSEVVIALTINDKRQNHYYELKAFEKFDTKKIQQLFDCFIKEVFIYSNFQQFNKLEELEPFSSPIKHIDEFNTFIDSGIRNKEGKPLRVTLYNN